MPCQLTSKILFASLSLLIASALCAHADVSAADVNGTWKSAHGEFKILALGHGVLQLEFSGVYEYESPQGPMANEGAGGGTAAIDSDTATFRPDGAEDECEIKLRFTGGKLIVTQNGICGFGHNVSAAGNYRRVSARQPNFDSGDGD